MADVHQPPYPRCPVASDLVLRDLRAALAGGARDFLAHPLYGLFFAAM